MPQGQQSSQSRSESLRGNQNARGTGSGQDRNDDGKGRGNFGNPQQHAQAGHQSSGNRGNAEQHAEAGRQSHKNDPNGHQNQGEQGQQGQQEGGTTTMEAPEGDRQEAIGQLRDLMSHLQQERQYHQGEVENIDKAFEEVRDNLNAILDEAQGIDSRSRANSGGARRGRPAKTGNRQNQGQGTGRGGRGQTRETRNGNETGTSVMLRIMEENGGSMNRADLQRESKEQGVSSPYSSLYSLQRSGKVEVDRNDRKVVKLTQEALKEMRNQVKQEDEEQDNQQGGA